MRGGSFPHPPDRPYLEAVTMLAAAAVCTTRARLGASVFILGHRHPVVMAKMLASIDALSTGRLIRGVGVGWWKQELELLGAPFHARGRQADEALRIFKALWTSEHPAFDGEFFRVHEIGSVVVVPLSTSEAQARRGPTAIPLAAGAGGLKKGGVALCHQVTTLDRAKLTERIGALAEDIVARVDGGLRVALDLE
jgi:alkanesulfonate monooxygenase SsuD/methylene tetrahydromethanopterin reductase-like flavin-dependent oxidoreductase (luciferase family)